MGEKSETGGNASWPQRGWTPLLTAQHVGLSCHVQANVQRALVI